MTPTRNRRYPSADAFDGSEGRTDEAVGGKRCQPQDQGSDDGQQNGNGRHHGFNRFAVGADEDGDWSGRRLSASPDQPVVLVVGLLDPPVGVRLVGAEKLFPEQAALPVPDWVPFAVAGGVGVLLERSLEGGRLELFK